MMHSERFIEQSGCPDLFHGTHISYVRSRCHWVSVSESEPVLFPIQKTSVFILIWMEVGTISKDSLLKEPCFLSVLGGGMEWKVGPSGTSKWWALLQRHRCALWYFLLVLCSQHSAWNVSGGALSLSKNLPSVITWVRPLVGLASFPLWSVQRGGQLLTVPRWSRWVVNDSSVTDLISPCA